MAADSQLRRALRTALLALACTGWFSASATEELADTVERIRPSIVGVGTYSAVRRPPARLMGTGFVIGDGQLAATNLHVVDVELDPGSKEFLVVFVGRGREVSYRRATIIEKDQLHDLVLLRFEGDKLPALTLNTSETVREGSTVAFTGFPIGAVLGLFPVTHHGIISAITPIVIQPDSAQQLTADKITALRSPYDILQLDATAYPGNSGSPVFLPRSGAVIGVINQVFVKAKKEDILRDPSGITYAIPVRYLRSLIAAHSG